MMIRPMLLASPAFIASLCMAAIALVEPLQHSSLKEYGPLNSAEAAALGNAAEVVRLVRAGADPAQVLPLRRHVIGESVQRATTLEAAMWSRRIQMIRLLESEGALADAAVRRDLACLARDLELPEIADHLGADRQSRCEPGEAVQRVAARSTER
jgi:hypothetical protein